MSEEKVPVEKVIDDMYSDNAVSSAARDYYYTNYATEGEKAEIDREKRIENIVAIVVWVIIIIAAGCCIGVPAWEAVIKCFK